MHDLDVGPDAEEQIGIKTIIRTQFPKARVRRNVYLSCNIARGTYDTSPSGFRRVEVNDDLIEWAFHRPDLTVYVPKNGLWTLACIIELDGEIHIKKATKTDRRNANYTDAGVPFKVFDVYNHEVDQKTQQDILAYVHDSIWHLR